MDEKLIEALQTIKDTCNQYEGRCYDCPMGHYTKCLVSDSEPHDWSIGGYTKFIALR